MKKGYRFTHMELYAKIKDYLEDYKTLAEIIELAEISKTSVIPYMRLLEDKRLVTSRRVRTNTKTGCTRVYKLSTENLEYELLG
jgi:transcription initiation factor IIE alpha subunit